jgi:4-hydroxy-2-oxoheptanedioate aldolase
LKNVLKEKLMREEAVVGCFVSLGHPDVTEVLSRIGFDWILIDGEHSPIGLETMHRMRQAMNGTDCTPIVRPAWNDPVLIKRILDIGAQGILVPWVNNKEEAIAAVRACKYPPEGIRGRGARRASIGDPDYGKTANDEVMVTVQIETREAVDNIEEILRVDGIDACFIGPYDLSSNLLGRVPPEYDNPEYMGAIDKVIEKSKKAGKPAGFYCNKDNITWALEKGFTYNTVGEADAFLDYGAKAALKAAGKNIT